MDAIKHAALCDCVAEKHSFLGGVVFYCFSRSGSQSLFPLITGEIVLSRFGCAEVGTPPSLNLQGQV